MKPAPFEYHAPESLDEALRLRSELGPESSVLAGGQSLVPMLNMRLAAPEALIDLRMLDELRYVRASNDGVAVGAMTTHRTLERSDEAHAVCPLLRESLELVAHSIVRNRGTIGGSIAHADPAAELPAVLAVLDGKVTARSVRGEREIPASELFTFHFTTSLEPDEILTEVWFPAVGVGAGSAFLEVSRRHGDYALAGAACVVANGSTRLAFTGVGPVPVLVESDDADAAAAAVSPADDIHARADYRRQLVRVLTGRGLARARARANPVTRRNVRVKVNGATHEREVEPRLLLSDFLRHELGLTGTHVGCEHGVCGCCTVRVDGEAMRSCLMFAVQANGAEVATVEGLAAPGGELHPIQEAFRECHGLQCGFCTPGFVMAASAYLEEEQRADLTDEDVREAISGNLCRCTGYQNIVEAVKSAAQTMYGTEGPR